MMIRAVILPGRVCAICLFLLLAALPTRAQDLPPSFQNLLQKQMTISAANLVSLERGETVTKLLKTRAKKEVVALGIVRVKAPGDRFIDKFRDITDFKKSATVLQIGKFSNPPRLTDLDALTLDPCCLEAIKNCKTGRCDLKLSVEMMARFREELNSPAANYSERANALARRLLFDYLKAYLQTGNAALIEYHDGINTVRLADEYRSLLEQSRFLADYAPEFYQYLEAFPKASSPNIEEFMYWSKEDYGLQPVLSLTHVIIYQRTFGNRTEVLIASKQLYANHYFEGSLGLTAFVEGAKGAAMSGSYMMYLNRSRADALQGWFLGLKRSLIGGRIREGLAKNLKLVKRRIESAGVQPSSTMRRMKPAAKGEKRVSRAEVGLPEWRRLNLTSILSRPVALQGILAAAVSPFCPLQRLEMPVGCGLADNLKVACKSLIGDTISVTVTQGIGDQSGCLKNLKPADSTSS